MKHLAKLSGLAVLCLFVGIIAPAYAQEEHHQDQAKPEQRTEQKRQAKQPKSPQHAQQKEEARQARSAQHAAQKQERAQARPMRQNQKASNNGGSRISDGRFRAHFGRDHAFRINRPVMVGGAPRFRYGGYWFGFVDPWPVSWYYTDQVYVDYIDGGYYLLSPVHPGVQISINLVL